MNLYSTPINQCYTHLTIVKDSSLPLTATRELHDYNLVIIDGTGGCHKEDLRCCQLWHSWHHNLGCRGRSIWSRCGTGAAVRCVVGSNELRPKTVACYSRSFHCVVELPGLVLTLSATKVAYNPAFHCIAFLGFQRFTICLAPIDYWLDTSRITNIIFFTKPTYTLRLLRRLHVLT